MVKYDNRWFLGRIQDVRKRDYKEYKFLEGYRGARVRLRAIHIPCGREILVLPNSFISRGARCPYCSKASMADKQRKSHEDYVKEIPDTITALSKYTGAFDKVKVRCSLCCETYLIIARDLTRRGCTRCLGHHRRTIEEVKEEVDRLSLGDYEVVSNSYKNPHEHIQIRHKVCGSIYNVTRANFRKGGRCPKCNLSIGETLVTAYLENKNMEFQPQKKFNDLIYKNPLSYDFYLPHYKTLIEYQGEQHYKPVKLFGGIEQFEIQKEIDSVKRDYARDNGYRLIEIPYTVRTYEEIGVFLEEYLAFS